MHRLKRTTNLCPSHSQKNVNRLCEKNVCHTKKKECDRQGNEGVKEREIEGEEVHDTNEHGLALGWAAKPFLLERACKIAHRRKGEGMIRMPPD